jgi:imidazole glycerol-phosphate synthase subunit HisF
MLERRLIPILLLDRRRLVKTTRFTKPVYVGDPLNVVRIFNEKEVDELILLDIGASRDGHSPDFDYIADLASECFVPLTYGGGVRSVDDAHRLFRSGVEKVSVNSALRQDPDLVARLSSIFGAQSIVGSIDVSASRNGEYRLHPHRRREHLSFDATISRCEELGVGEILLQAVHREGTLQGPDEHLLRHLPTLDVPLIYAGGVGSLDQAAMANSLGADAVGAGAWFVFHGPHRAVLIWYPTEANTGEQG